MPIKVQASSPNDLSSWVDSRQEKGLYFFTREEAIQAFQFTEEAFKKAAARLAKKNRILRIRSGFFVIVPLEYRFSGILPVEWFIADLMVYLEKPYYVGLLSAASLQGAAHQQPQQFQVVTTAPQREIRKRGLAIRFFFKTNFNATPVTQMEKAGYAALVLDLASLIADKNPPFTRLDPSLPAGGSGKDARWRLLINTDVEGDL